MLKKKNRGKTYSLPRAIVEEKRGMEMVTVLFVLNQLYLECYAEARGL